MAAEATQKKMEKREDDQGIVKTLTSENGTGPLDSQHVPDNQEGKTRNVKSRSVITLRIPTALLTFDLEKKILVRSSRSRRRNGRL